MKYILIFFRIYVYTLNFDCVLLATLLDSMKPLDLWKENKNYSNKEKIYGRKFRRVLVWRKG